MKDYNFKVKMNYKSRNGKDVFRKLTGTGKNIEEAFENLKNSYYGKDIEGTYLEVKEVVLSENNFTFYSLGGETQDNIDIECEAHNCDSIIEKSTGEVTGGRNISAQ